MDRIIIIDSLSKRFSACGARIGFIVTKNKQILSQLMVLGMARLCPPTIGQMGAIESFKKMDEFMGEMIEEYERRRNIVYEELKKIKKITTYLPEGAFYTIAKLPVEDAEEFIKWLLTSFHLNGRTVMVAPLDGFYLSQNKGKNEIRIAYVLEEERLKEAMLILRKGLEEYGRITQ
jgi:aspartate aminotransferase